MAEPAGQRMTPEEFFAWQAAQDGLDELVDGVPVPPVKDDDRRHPSLAYILLVETRFPSAVFYRRDGESRDEVSFEGLDAVITLADIDEDVSFEPGRTISTR